MVAGGQGGACMVAGGMRGYWGVCMVAGGHAWLWGGVCMVRGGRDTVNERAVRILLECILVTCKSSNASFSTSKSVKSKWSLK